MTECVATFITRPETGDALRAAITAASEIADVYETVELSRDEAIDIHFRSNEDLDVLRRRFFAIVTGLEVDVVVQPQAHRRKKLLIADMDSTMIGQECIDELADFAGLKDKVADITERAMRGEIEFEPALRERVALLAGLPESTIAAVLAERIIENPGARELVWTMRANGARTLLVSGGFTAFAENVAERLGFEEVQANRLDAAGGRLTGQVIDPILGRQAKVAALEDAIIRFGLDAEETLAVGDGANDLAMIGRAGLGVAYRAKPKVAEAADARVDIGDLRALLFMQGYRKEDILR